MIVGALIVAVIMGALGALVAYLMDFPIWIVVLAYPVVGSVTLIFSLISAEIVGRALGATARRYFPVARSTTPTVASSTLKSFAKDKFRS